MKRLRFLPLLALLGFCVLSSARAADASSPDNKRNYNHTLALADRVRISIYQEDDLTSVTRIDARGKVNLPLVGEVVLGGLTVVQAQAAIEAAYKDGRFLRNPQVTVSVEEIPPAKSPSKVGYAIRAATPCPSNPPSLWSSW